MLSNNNGLYLCAAAQYVLLYLVLTVNSYQFQILQSYTRSYSCRSYALLVYM